MSFGVAGDAALLAGRGRLSAGAAVPIGDAVGGGLVIGFRDPGQVALELFYRRQPF